MFATARPLSRRINAFLRLATGGNWQASTSKLDRNSDGAEENTPAIVVPERIQAVMITGARPEPVMRRLLFGYSRL
jgi:hypothetical protein